MILALVWRFDLWEERPPIICLTGLIIFSIYHFFKIFKISKF